MSHYLITSGPTREYLDPVRFLTNASSGRMGSALAQAAVDEGHMVTVISGPVQVEYPPSARVIQVVTTEDMLRAAEGVFPESECLVAAAAPCDYRPRRRAEQKLAKSGHPLTVEFEEGPDILASLASRRTGQLIVGFALETQEHRARALAKLRRKGSDLIVLNDASAMEADSSTITVLDQRGDVLLHVDGPKNRLATELIRMIDRRRRGMGNGKTGDGG